jgi:urate oxidase
MLQWTDREGASKCTYTIKPLFGKGMKTKTGKLLNLPSVGVNIHIQSSYIDLDEHFQIIWEFMRYIDADRFQHSIDRSRSIIYQMARHIRYHEKHEHDMVTMLQAIEKESSMLGDSKLVKTLRSGKYDMYKLDNPNFLLILDTIRVLMNFLNQIYCYTTRDPSKAVEDKYYEAIFVTTLMIINA